MSNTSNPIPIIDGIEALGADYDLMLCDVWGVLHNGKDVFEGAVDACRRFRAKGGTVILISNSPRPRGPLIEQLDDIGVAARAYDGVVTSGDVTRSYLSGRPGVRVFHLGPDRDKGIFHGLDVAFGPAEEADIVVCSGLFDDTSETPDDYAELLARLKQLSLTMICANPDLMVERGTALIYCAGALAQAYEALGGEVVYAGKPYQPIYDMAQAAAVEIRDNEVAPERVIAIGDGLHTDMAGAANAGVDGLYVASGVHLQNSRSGLDEGGVEELFRDQGVKPIAAMVKLQW